ncbi:hypothetical protein SAMN05216369_2259 [Marinobacter antarcticus]|uniref:Uncharacterized protein n=1 Tax=Marinobacter antarcticus TaxID=564117 RepID=A0A1M6SUG6_9GAMM|nr:hypothetical protein SAMN05216369_2259 [Marinobacter antarcticus]
MTESIVEIREHEIPVNLVNPENRSIEGICY